MATSMMNASGAEKMRVAKPRIRQIPPTNSIDAVTHAFRTPYRIRLGQLSGLRSPNIVGMSSVTVGWMCMARWITV